jgi:hypothetical protein
MSGRRGRKLKARKGREGWEPPGGVGERSEQGRSLSCVLLPKFLSENLKRRDYLEDLDVDRLIDLRK